MRTIKTTTIFILALGLLAGSAVGVAAQDDPSMEGAEVTGRVTVGPPHDLPPAQEIDGLLVGEDSAFRFGWETSDPRLTGDVTRTVNWRWDEISGTAIDSATYELTNDGGSWLGDGRGYTSETHGNVFPVALSGRDGYEGLSALVVIETPLGEDTGDLRGVIFPSAMPEVPEPYVAE